MKVLELKTNKTLDVNDCYGARLIEQGKAVIAAKKGEANVAKVKAESKPDIVPAVESEKGKAKKQSKE